MQERDNAREECKGDEIEKIKQEVENTRQELQKTKQEFKDDIISVKGNFNCLII